MRFNDSVCYVFLAITVSATCVQAKKENEIEEPQPDRRIHKRDATVLIDNFPFERYFQKPKMVYRRLSKHRYVPPHSKYGSPKPKHGVKPPRNGPKKYRPKANGPKRTMPNYKKRSPKPKYGPPNRSPKPYRPPYKAPGYSTPYSYFSPISSGFGEPPAMYDYRPQKQLYAKPPVDSYGEPIKPVVEEVYPTANSYHSQRYPSTTGHLDNQDFNIREGYQTWVDFVPGEGGDTVYEYSNKVSVATKPEAPVYVTPTPLDYYDDVVIDQEEGKQKQNLLIQKKKRFFSDNSKIVKKPWKLPKKPEAEGEIIVGGQYAEPPGRVVQKFQPSAPMYDEDEDFSPREPFEVIPSATKSPYVNYKNSNMAFSPQNLNDAFSIVDK